MVTSSTGGVVSSQSFDPWGKVLSGGNVTQTKLNYTGQRLDDTGLLYYHARYYDPVLGRFISPDSIVPSTGVALQNDFNEKGVTVEQNVTNRKNSRPEQGPTNPQNLNRYSYVTNNPLLHTDPTGHCRTADGDSRPYDSGPGCPDGVSSGANAGVNCGEGTNLGSLGCIPGQYVPGSDSIGGPRFSGGPEESEGTTGEGNKGAYRGPSYSLDPKIEKQMASRGWTKADIDNTLADPIGTRTVLDTRHDPVTGLPKNEPATAYIRVDGSYVIRNDRTGEIVQISDRNNPNWKPPW